MHILVTGGSGLIGSRLIKALLRENSSKICHIGKLESANKIRSFLTQQEAERVSCIEFTKNIDEINISILDIYNFDIIFHFAGPDWKVCNSNFIESLDFKFQSLSFLNKLISTNGGKLVTASTIHVHNQANFLGTRLEKYIECHKEAEKYALKINPGISILRLPNIIGLPLYKNSSSLDLVSCNFAKQIIRKKSISIESGPNESRNFLSISDLIVILTEYNRISGGIKDIKGHRVRIIDLALLISNEYKNLFNFSENFPVITNKKKLFFDPKSNLILPESFIIEIKNILSNLSKKFAK